MRNDMHLRLLDTGGRSECATATIADPLNLQHWESAVSTAWILALGATSTSRARIWVMALADSGSHACALHN